MVMRNEFRMLALVLLTSACAPMGAAWTPEESPKEVAVHVASESYVVKLDRHQKALPQGQHEQLVQFVSHLGDLNNVEFSLRRVHRGAKLAVLTPVAKELVRLGADPHRIYVLNEIGFDYQGQVADVEIITKRYIAAAPNCPDWTQPDAIGGQNVNGSNFGCATAAALAIQVADPRDLLRGRELGPAPGAHEVGGIVRYNTDNVKPLPDTSSQNQQVQSSN